jgi:sugar phosphate isomerase/epimerase
MQTKNPINRRQFISGAAALTAAAFVPGSILGNSLMRRSTMASAKFKGVNIGVITYSFRSMPGSAEDLLNYMTQLGLEHTELMGEPAEAFAGAPEAPPWKRRNEMTDADRAGWEKYREEIVQWRTSAPMDKFKELRKMYNKEGVNIDVIKFGSMGRMSPAEIDYCFNVAKTVGAKGITLEISDEDAKKLAPFADKHKRLIGYHNHTQVKSYSWDMPLSYSKYNALNLDVGHYVAANNGSPIPLINQYHDRILNLHMKDRKVDNGGNMPWGEGDTPLREILQLMKKKEYAFMAAIELEYEIPEGSDAVKEVGKCIDFCKDALA